MGPDDPGAAGVRTAGDNVSPKPETLEDATVPKTDGPTTDDERARVLHHTPPPDRTFEPNAPLPSELGP
jgi:hypothetical protein